MIGASPSINARSSDRLEQSGLFLGSCVSLHKRRLIDRLVKVAQGWPLLEVIFRDIVEYPVFDQVEQEILEHQIGNGEILPTHVWTARLLHALSKGIYENLQ